MRRGCCDAFGGFGADRYKKMVEYGFESLMDWPMVQEPEETDAEYEARVAEKKALLDEAGMAVGQVHAHFIYPPHDETPTRRLISEDWVKTAIRYAALIGSKYVVYHPLMPYGAQNDPDPEGTWGVNEEFIRKLLPYAKEKGVILCIENMGLKPLSVSSVEQMVDFVRRINDDNFKFCLDTGHARNVELEPADAVRIAGKELHTLHVHDNNGKNDNHWLPLTGVIDFKAFVEALEEVGYAGDFNLEINGKFPNLSTNLSANAKIQIAKILLDDFL